MPTEIPVTETLVLSKIYFLRNQKVMLDEDLAALYGVATKRLNEQVKRNPERFPEDFMFQINEEDLPNLRSQFATSSWGGRRTLPYAFTEHGVLMLSSVLSSSTAVQVNIAIMRVYTKLREMLATHKDILLKLEQLESRMMKQELKGDKIDKDIQVVFKTLKELLYTPEVPRKRIGFTQENK
ncbi:MAG: ORF6N domain-containing protein [Bacteroidota bacterium]